MYWNIQYYYIAKYEVLPTTKLQYNLSQYSKLQLELLGAQVTMYVCVVIKFILASKFYYKDILQCYNIVCFSSLKFSNTKLCYICQRIQFHVKKIWFKPIHFWPKRKQDLIFLVTKYIIHIYTNLINNSLSIKINLISKKCGWGIQLSS